jgi:hypothetical protein
MLRNALLALICLAAPGFAVADRDPFLRFFPTATEVPGLKAMGDARYCGDAEELTVIYDGGYQRFVQAGVVSASQRFFQVPSGTVQVTLHEMKEEKAAETFLVSLCKDIKAPVESGAFKQPNSRLCTTSGQDSAYGYLARGTLLAMVSIDRGDLKTARAVLRAIGDRATGAKRSR